MRPPPGTDRAARRTSPPNDSFECSPPAARARPGAGGRLARRVSVNETSRRLAIRVEDAVVEVVVERERLRPADAVLEPRGEAVPAEHPRSVARRFAVVARQGERRAAGVADQISRQRPARPKPGVDEREELFEDVAVPFASSSGSSSKRLKETSNGAVT